MVQQVSDAELEIMKIVWGNPSETTLFPYIMESLAAHKPVIATDVGNCKGLILGENDDFGEGSAKGLVSNLIMGDLLADEEYEELKKLLERGREKP